MRANPDGRRARRGSLGPGSTVGEGCEAVRRFDQRPGGDDRGEAGLPFGVPQASLPGFGGRLLRVVAVGKMKQPYFIHRSDDAVFTFAGLWECRPGDNGPALETCTIVTTAANDLTRPLHDRMPVILDAVDRDSWLAPDAATVDLQARMKSYPSASLVVNAVSTVVNNVLQRRGGMRPAHDAFFPARPTMTKKSGESYETIPSVARPIEHIRTSKVVPLSAADVNVIVPP